MLKISKYQNSKVKISTEFFSSLFGKKKEEKKKEKTTEDMAMDLMEKLNIKTGRDLISNAKNLQNQLLNLSRKYSSTVDKMNKVEKAFENEIEKHDKIDGEIPAIKTLIKQLAMLVTEYQKGIDEVIECIYNCYLLLYLFDDYQFENTYKDDGFNDNKINKINDVLDACEFTIYITDYPWKAFYHVYEDEMNELTGKLDTVNEENVYNIFEIFYDKWND